MCCAIGVGRRIARRLVTFADLVRTLPNVAGAALLYFYFNWIDPLGLATFILMRGLFGPLAVWRARLDAGGDPATVPEKIRRRAVNRPMIHAVFSMTAWTLAGLFYFPYQAWIVGLGVEQGWRVFSGIVFIGGPVASALSFLVSEYYARREVPIFYPDGRKIGRASCRGRVQIYGVV